MSRTVEPQYECTFEALETWGRTKLGLMTNQVWIDDPRRLTFLLARYKFVSKMFVGLQHVLEIGCADAFGTRIVRQTVPRVTAIDFDPAFVAEARELLCPRWDVEFAQHDMLQGPFPGSYDGAYALDVFEHIPPEQEDLFLRNIIGSLTQHGVLILGSPSLESQTYASPPSKAGHVNCKSGNDLRACLARHFHNVFVFSMNDEVVHTGFHPMAHYLFGLCCGPKTANQSVTVPL